MRVHCSIALIVALTSVRLSAQVPAGVTAPTNREPVGSGGLDWWRGDTSHAESRLPLGAVPPRIRSLAPLASAIIPGSGQLVLGNQRFMAYAAIEAVAWLSYAKDVREQNAQEAAFKSLARRVARAHFTTGSPDLLPDAPWSYYENMRDDLESGQYSLGLAGAVVPETVATTYNGKKWLLALSTSPSPAAALEQYKRTAIRPEFEWSWKNAQLQYDIFTRMTFKRDDAYNAGTHTLIIIALNHVLSMVDAFTTARVRATRQSNGRTAIGASVPW